MMSRPFVSNGIMEQSPGRLAEHLYTAPPCNNQDDKIADRDDAEGEKGDAPCVQTMIQTNKQTMLKERRVMHLVYPWLARVRLGSSNKKPAKRSQNSQF